MRLDDLVFHVKTLRSTKYRCNFIPFVTKSNDLQSWIGLNRVFRVRTKVTVNEHLIEVDI